MGNSNTSPIQLDGISKCYRIFDNPQDRAKQALRDSLQGLIGKSSSVPLYREHWVLRDINFELEPGEAVGILGRNGAGKSTLLQIIAGTLEPTSGSIRTSGRITALLELGSGFNPDFTGRENVFLNAQILGLTKRDTLERFDDIASFADIGDFIDQPVKTYSSGMMMRLAFAVQTAVDPKILIVDEALAVGDMFFQAKCMARIKRLVDDGVTLLFVSHDVNAVRQICSRALLLSEGRQAAFGPTRKVSDEYIRCQLEERNQAARKNNSINEVLREKVEVKKIPNDDNGSLSNKSEVIDIEKCKARDGQQLERPSIYDELMFGIDSFASKARVGRSGTQWATIRNVQMLRHGQHTMEFDFDEEAEIRILTAFDRDMTNANFVLKLRTLQGLDVIFCDTRLQEKIGYKYSENSEYLFSWRVRLPLMHGNYSLAVAISIPPSIPGEDWVFVDTIPHAYDFKMGARQNGMIGGLVAPKASLDITKLTRIKRGG